MGELAPAFILLRSEVGLGLVYSSTDNASLFSKSSMTQLHLSVPNVI